MNEHLGHDKYERSGESSYRNGIKSKSVHSKYAEFEVDVPRDRNSTFDPWIVPKRKKDISGIEDKIISMYAKGMITTQISEMVEVIYGFEISEGMVSDITLSWMRTFWKIRAQPVNPGTLYLYYGRQYITSSGSCR